MNDSFSLKIDLISFFGFFLLSIILFIIFVFRDFSVGTDTYDYLLGYKFPNLSIQNRNIGYNFFQSVLRNISLNERFFLFVMGFISQVLLFINIKKYSFYPFFSLLLYSFLFFPFSLNILRQFLVISLFYLLGIKFILSKKFIHYFLLILVLSTIHEISILFFILYVPNFNKYSYLKYLLVWLFSFITVFFSNFSKIDLSFLDFYFRSIFVNLPNYLIEFNKLSSYDSSFNSLIIDQFLFVIIFFIFHKKMINDKISILFFNIYFCGVVLQNLFFFIPVFHRASLIFLIAFVFISGRILSQFYLRLLFLFISFIIFYFRFVINGVGGVF